MSSPAVVSIAVALRSTGRDVTIEGVVTSSAALLDASRRRIVVQDGSAAIEVLVPKGSQPPSLGSRVRVTGRVGAAYGAPRLRATSIVRLGSAGLPAALRVSGALSGAHTWRLVAISGRIHDVRKLGDRWVAEVTVGSRRLVVTGQPGARIPVAILVEGRSIEVIGIVRPAYPTASDRRPSVLPRSIADVRVAAGPSASTGARSSATTPGGAARHEPGASDGAPAGSSAATASFPLADLADLERRAGTTVRVGGIVVGRTSDGFTLDDGTAIGRIVLVGGAVDHLPLIEPGDPVNVTGRVESEPNDRPTRHRRGPGGRRPRQPPGHVGRSRPDATGRRGRVDVPRVTAAPCPPA